MVEINCGGLCCKRFYLPLGPVELDQYSRRSAARSRGHVLREGEAWTEDGAVMGEAFVYLGYFPVDACGRPSQEFGHYWTPKVCREYPYGRRCEYPGCKGEE